MDAQQRFMRRRYLLANMDVLLRESQYHRDNDEAERLPGLQVWTWDEPEGKGNVIF